MKKYRIIEQKGKLKVQYGIINSFRYFQWFTAKQWIIPFLIFKEKTFNTIEDSEKYIEKEIKRDNEKSSKIEIKIIKEIK